MSTYVISDLHGQYKLFKKLLEKAAFSGGDKLYMLGDAIDRGPDGIKILRHVMDAPNMEFLLGNHELMMLNSIDPEGRATADYANIPGFDAPLWIYYNGGHTTYDRYRRLKKSERQRLLHWLFSRPLATVVTVKDKTYHLSHSYFNRDLIDVPFSKIEDYQDAWDIAWLSPFREDLYAPIQEYMELKPWNFIIGHVPVCHIPLKGGPSQELAPIRVENVMDIDGGCAHHGDYDKDYKGAILLRLDDEKIFTMSFAEL